MAPHTCDGGTGCAQQATQNATGELCVTCDGSSGHHVAADLIHIHWLPSGDWETATASQSPWQHPCRQG